MRRKDLSVRATGLVVTGELAVHEARYLLAPAPDAGHGYLPVLAVVSVVLMAVAAGHLAGGLESARRTGRGEPVTIRFSRAWPALALAVAAVFTVQEVAEGLLGGAGAGALLLPFASGGWVAAPLTVAVSALLALALSGAGAAVGAAARAARRSLRPRRPSPRPLPDLPRRAFGIPLALNLAGRAPPHRG
jgi:hypothetical protein